MNFGDRELPCFVKGTQPIFMRWALVPIILVAVVKGLQEGKFYPLQRLSLVTVGIDRIIEVRWSRMF